MTVSVVDGDGTVREAVTGDDGVASFDDKNSIVGIEIATYPTTVQYTVGSRRT